MKYKLCFLLLFIAGVCNATAATSDKVEKKDKPSLGTCDQYTDYYIYKCQPFKCKLPIQGFPGVFREMETIGYEKGMCLHKYTLVIRSDLFPSTDLRYTCRLSEAGRVKLAHHFKRYKEGDIEIYSNPPATDSSSDECSL